MARTKKKSTAPRALIRSDRNLLAFGLFGAALLIVVFIYFDNQLTQMPAQNAMSGERTYRVETAPAAITEDNPQNTPSDITVTPQNQGDDMPDY